MNSHEPGLQRPAPEDVFTVEEGNVVWDYLLVLRKHWVLIVSAFVLFLAGGIFHSSRQPKLYRATASISITAPRPRMIGRIQLDQTSGYYPWDRTYVNTQKEILKSRSMGEKVLAAMDNSLCKAFFGVDKERLSPKLAVGCIQVSDKKESNIVHLSCSGTRPKECAALVNLVTNVFIAENSRHSEDSQGALLKWLKEETPVIREKMLEQKKKLLEFEKENPEVSYLFKEKNGGKEDMVERLRRELQELDIQLSSAEIQYKKCQQARAKNTTDAIFALNLLANDEFVQQLQQKLFSLEEKSDELQLKYKSDHPKVASVSRSIKKLKEKIHKEAELALKRQEQIYLDLLAREKKLKKMHDEEQEKSLKFQEKYVRYEHRRDEYEATKRTYDSFIDKLKQLDSTTNYQFDNISLVDKAQVPLVPYSPNKTRTYLLSCVLGLVAGIGLAFLLEMFDQTVKTPEEIRQIMDGPVLGFVPFISPKEFTKNSQAVIEHEKSTIAEAFRSVSTSIFLADENSHDRCFVVTSPMAKDGKTTISCNLALTIAKSGHKTLLVDGDMRKPQLRRLFQLDKGIGLSELLQGETEIEQIAREVGENLWCLPAGKIPGDAYQTIHKSRLKDILQQMQLQYQYVIIDCPPIGITNDALLFGKVTGGIVFVVSIQQSHKKLLKQISGRLQALEMQVKGVVINDTKGRSLDRLNYYNYYGQYHYYKYYKSYYGEDESSASS